MTDLPSFDDCIRAGCKLWGKVTSRTRTEARWGHHGSKHLTIGATGPVWYDHETGDQGGALDLLERAGMLPPPRHNGPGRLNGPIRSSEFARTHDYRDESGQLLFQVCKKHDGSWTQRKPNGRAWEYKLGRVRRVLYRLPQLVAASKGENVYIAEGEKDCDALAGFGLVATTNPGGAGKWRAEFNASLAGRPCIILPDNDAAGRSHASEVRNALTGVALSIVVITLPGLPAKGDVSDWIAAGGNRDELIDLVNEARGEPPAWLSLTQRSGKERKPIPNLRNALIAVSQAPRLKRCLAYDEMLCAVTYCGKPLKDDDITAIQESIQIAGIPMMGRDNVHHAIDKYARQERPFHPLRDELAALRWDGRPRLDSWLTAYLGVESTAYAAAIGKMFLIAMIKRVFEPGCQSDYMLILEGEQGDIKSSLCRALAGDRYFSDSLSLERDKDASIHLRGQWLIEIAELHVFNNKENSYLKSFISRREERYRPPFGTEEVFEPRQCLFIGTSNKDTYLRDDTGGRRFWPVKCTTVKLEAFIRDRDQLLAEAVACYRAGDKTYPDRDFEREHIKPEQAARFEHDVWTEKILNWLDNNAFTTTVSVRQVAIEALQMSDKDHDTRMERRIISVLKMSGWQCRHTQKGNLWDRPLPPFTR